MIKLLETSLCFFTENSNFSCGQFFKVMPGIIMYTFANGLYPVYFLLHQEQDFDGFNSISEKESNPENAQIFILLTATQGF